MLYWAFMPLYGLSFILKMAPANTGAGPRHAVKGGLSKATSHVQWTTSIGNSSCLTQEKPCQGWNFKSLLINVFKTHVNQLNQTWFSQRRELQDHMLQPSTSTTTITQPIPSVTPRWLLSTSWGDDSVSSWVIYFNAWPLLQRKNFF